jgi:RNA polymerase sigma-70 factor (ECF subfamily)
MSALMTTTTIVEGCRRGERRFQRELVNRFSPQLHTVALRYLPDNAHAQDVLQDSLVKILTRIEQYTGGGSFEGWMYQIVIRTALNRLDRKWMRREVSTEAVSLDSAVEPYVYDHLAAEDIMTCVADLPDGYRQVFNLYAIEGYRHREIAQMMGISEVNSRTKYARARQLLQAILSSPKFGLRHAK